MSEVFLRAGSRYGKTGRYANSHVTTRKLAECALQSEPDGTFTVRVPCSQAQVAAILGMSPRLVLVRAEITFGTVTIPEGEESWPPA